MKKKWMIEIIVLLFVLLFVYAGSSKLMDYNKFRIELGKSPLLTAFAGKVAVVVPVTELIIAVLLVLSRTRLIALYASFTLMVMFTTYIIVILKWSDYIPCSCGGVLQQMNWNQHLIFNTVFILLGAAGVMLTASPGGRAKAVIPSEQLVTE
ncbi:MauE/DoxX family redox-associated membrane protein [Deminuibacter soli]|uniref:Methylamine utilisation protein MauE domain-containing protein n=1 Tax=Deminuibacter soli TaxID=2291815 RepID=A0A3E1NL66_9BACT|nr:MauE/DoxX family redox-associated membrane protein [Deminuibacter soli]RFM28675.1 hypothetical protein DXN05_07740 [Deminuibacter soli]